MRMLVSNCLVKRKCPQTSMDASGFDSHSKFHIFKINLSFLVRERFGPGSTNNLCEDFV